MGTLDFSRLVREFICTESGGTGIEYALVAGGISIIIAAGVHGIADSTLQSFENVADSFPGGE